MEVPKAVRTEDRLVGQTEAPKVDRRVGRLVAPPEEKMKAKPGA